MPAFQNSPFAPPVLHMKGVPTYLWGSYDPRVGNTRAYVTNTVLATDVATVTLQILDGPMPVVGAPISIINSTNGGGAFNVNRAIITAVSINAGTGAGTVTFALTHADISTAADGGSVIMENAEIPAVKPFFSKTKATAALTRAGIFSSAVRRNDFATRLLFISV